MSLLPLGNSSADEPAHRYFDHMGTQLPMWPAGATAHPELRASGFFREFWGPSGGCPVQLMGILKNGDFVYFRARGKKVELEISREVDGEVHACYRKRYEIKHELGTGILPESVAVPLIKRWLTDYSGKLASLETAYAGEPYELTEVEETLDF